MTITVIGHGYVGLVTATVFADFGNTVYVIGRTEEKIERLKSGDPLIFEPGLEELLKKNIAAKRLIFTLDYEPAIQNSEVVFIAVGTPSADNGEADLSQVFEVAKKLSSYLKKGYTVVSCKSTVPVGTNAAIKKIVADNKPKDATFDVASCPEFLREGTGIPDTVHPHRVVIGVENDKAKDVMLDLHSSIESEKVVINLETAELIKYASNSLLATKISFANLISFYCEKTGADVEGVLTAVGLDKRIGQSFLNPGIGYGGACFPKDVKALIYTGKSKEIDTSLLDSVEKINKDAKDNFIEKIIKHSPGKRLGIWGLSFKPDTDDIREAPSVYILNKLLSEGFSITVYDPEASKHIEKRFGTKISYVSDPFLAVKDADSLCILTEWDEFKQIDLQKVKTQMSQHVVFDGRNLYPVKKMKELGFTYYSIGRKPVLG